MDEVLDREVMFARGGALWSRLRAHLDTHLSEPLAPAGDWTGHDVYAHFARWTNNTLQNLETVLAGGTLPSDVEDEDVLNERWRAADRALPADRTRAHAIRAREDLVAALSALSHEQWRAFGHLFTEDIAGRHYQHHLDAIEQAATQ